MQCVESIHVLRLSRATPCVLWLLAVAIQVGRCDNCAAPVARLSGPSFFRTPCDLEAGQFSTIFVGSDASGDPSGRPLKSRTWGIKTGKHDDSNGEAVICAEPSQELVDHVSSSNG